MLFDGALLAVANVSPYRSLSRRGKTSQADLSPDMLRSLRSTRLQILFLASITALIGPRKTLLYFARKDKLRGTAAFFAGILLVFFFKVRREKGKGRPKAGRADALSFFSCTPPAVAVLQRHH